MSQTLERIRKLVTEHEVMISDHGYDELANDNIFVQDILDGIVGGIVIGGLPKLSEGTLCFGVEFDKQQKPIHVVWGIPKGESSPAVVVTAYRPDPERWTEDFVVRKR